MEMVVWLERLGVIKLLKVAHGECEFWTLIVRIQSVVVKLGKGKFFEVKRGRSRKVKCALWNTIAA